jgi:periplasmic protein TonB
MRDISHPPAEGVELPTTPTKPLKRSAWGLMSLCTAALLASCAAPIPAPAPPPPPPPPPAPAPAPAPVATLPAPALISNARTPRDYRQDGARHIYSKNGNRIFKGQLPPLMHAVGVLQIDVDGRGNVRGLNWMRAPSHVPDVMREIERTVRAAAPFPAPVQLGSVTYTDTWLWDRSGNFQLDTLTEGQRLR